MRRPQQPYGPAESVAAVRRRTHAAARRPSARRSRRSRYRRGRSGQDVPPLPENIAVVRDDKEGRGPLQGLAAGLNALHGRVDASYFVVVRRAVSTAGVRAPPHRLDGRRDDMRSARRRPLPSAGRRLSPGNRGRRDSPSWPKIDCAPYFLFDAVPTRMVEAAELADVDPTFETLRNLNTPEEYEAAISNRPRIARIKRINAIMFLFASVVVLLGVIILQRPPHSFRRWTYAAASPIPSWPARC